MRNVVVTGANRGIGLELARQALEAGDAVVGGCRRPQDATELRGLVERVPDRAEVVALDVDDPRSVRTAAEVIGERLGTVDLLVNNAAVKSAGGSGDAPAVWGPLAALDADALLGVLRTNIVGPALVTQALAPLLAAAGRSTVVNITSGLGSLDRTSSARDYGYSISKAGLNMLTRKLAFDLAGQGTQVIALNPGWVQTEMGGAGAALTPEESVRDILALLGDLPTDATGRFYDRDGGQLAW